MQQNFNQRIEAFSAMLKNSLSELEKWCSGDGCYTFGWSAGSFGSDEGRVTRIFVVHGHDNAVKESVARFLEKLNLKPIILQEQLNKGQTVIEKFEAHSDVGFAIVHSR